MSSLGFGLGEKILQELSLQEVRR